MQQTDVPLTGHRFCLIFWVFLSQVKQRSLRKTILHKYRACLCGNFPVPILTDGNSTLFNQCLIAGVWMIPFPMRHYFMIYRICVFNGYPIMDAWPYIGALIIIAALPLIVLHNIKKAMLTYVYIP